MGLLQRPQLHRHVLEMEVLTAERKPLVAESAMQHLECFLEDVACVIERDAMESELERRDSSADADLEPAAAQMVEHANLFDQAQRLIERQQVNQRAEMQPPGMLGGGGKKDVGRRRHPERGRMMLRDMETEDSAAIVILHQLEPLLVERLQMGRAAGPLDMIENAEA